MIAGMEPLHLVQLNGRLGFAPGDPDIFGAQQCAAARHRGAMKSFEA
jgi:hypothetical protein